METPSPDSLLFLCFISNTMAKALATRPEEHSEKIALGLSANFSPSHFPHQRHSTQKSKVLNAGEYHSQQNAVKVPKLADNDADDGSEWGGFLGVYTEGKSSRPQLINPENSANKPTPTDETGDDPNTHPNRSDSQTAKPKGKNRLRLYCGKKAIQHNPKLSQRILNGKEAEPHSWPWQVLLRVQGDGRRNLCGGSIIPVRLNGRESDVVLTAAHCIQEKNTVYNSVTVVAGLHNINFQDGHSSQRRNSHKAVPHPDYSDNGLGKYDKDVALLFMEKPFQFTDTVQPICLPIWDEKVPAGEKCVVTGWGTNNISERQPQSKLQQLHLTILHGQKCEEWFGDIWVRGHMICAEGQNGQTCQGDSGGPVQCEGKDGRWTVQGIVSVGGTCGNVKDPGIYSRVAVYWDWIMEEIIKHSTVREADQANESEQRRNTDHNSKENRVDIEKSSIQHLGQELEISKNNLITPANTQKNRSSSCTLPNCTNSGLYGYSLCNWLVKDNQSRCRTDGCFARVHCCRSCADALGAKSYKLDDPKILSMPLCEDSSECEEKEEEDTKENLFDLDPSSSEKSVPCESNRKDKNCMEWSCRNYYPDFVCNDWVKFNQSLCITNSAFARVDCCRSCAVQLVAESLDPHDPVILSLPCEDNSNCEVIISGDLSLCAEKSIQRECVKTCGLCV